MSENGVAGKSQHIKVHSNKKEFLLLCMSTYITEYEFIHCYINIYIR